MPASSRHKLVGSGRHVKGHSIARAQEICSKPWHLPSLLATRRMLRPSRFAAAPRCECENYAKAQAVERRMKQFVSGGQVFCPFGCPMQQQAGMAG